MDRMTNAKAGKAPISVSDALKGAKAAMNAMPTFVVAGEVSGFRGPNARSGHCYFQVKDDSAAMDVIVWRGTYAHMGVKLENGLSVVLTGKFDVYVGTGRLSFIASSVELVGEGLLRQQIEALKQKLYAEGLLADERKRKVERFCTRVAVVTSLSGSVLDDVKRTLRRRNPIVELLVAGCAVQGPGAPASIISALHVAEAAQPEAILLVRGGGSFEDLMTFNDEALCRAVAACTVPVVTGIGHEPDVTLCDFVADKRCSTPTAAAESVAPAIDELAQVNEARRLRMGAALQKRIDMESVRGTQSGERATKAMRVRLSAERANLDALSRHRCLEDPFGFVTERTSQLLQSEQRLLDAMPRVLEGHNANVQRQAERLDTGMSRNMDGFGRTEHVLSLRLMGSSGSITAPHQATLQRMAASLDALSPLKVLSRGYSIAQNAEGRVITDATSVRVGDEVTVRLNAGSIAAQVTKVGA